MKSYHDILDVKYLLHLKTAIGKSYNRLSTEFLHSSSLKSYIMCAEITLDRAIVALKFDMAH